MGHAGAQAAQRGQVFDELETVQEFVDLLPVVRHRKTQHRPAAVGEHPLGQLPLRVGVEARMVDAPHVRVFKQRPGEQVRRFRSAF